MMHTLEINLRKSLFAQVLWIN